MKKKIAFVIGHLSLGGGQRVISTLSNILIDTYDITIITSVKSNSFYHLDERIQVVSCFEEHQINLNPNPIQSLKLNFDLSRKISRAVKREKADIVVGFITKTNILAIIAAKMNRIPCIVSERTNPLNDKVPKFWKMLRNFLYPFADFVVVQTRLAHDFYSKTVNAKKIVLIPNPINPDFVSKRKHVERENIILNVGRLHWVKNQKMLIEAFANINPEGWKLQILGDGDQKDNLQQLITDKNLNNVALLGGVKDVDQYYNKAKIFAFTSRFEGFPNALLEAMFFGLPCVSTDCPSGPAELIEPGKNGFLVGIDDQHALEEKLKILVENDPLREKMGAFAESSTHSFKAEEVVILWRDLISRCLSK